MSTKVLACGVAVLVLSVLPGAAGQPNSYGLIRINLSADSDKMEQTPTSSRLYILGPTNEYKTPILRLVIADKPFIRGRLSLFEGTIVKNPLDHTMETFKIPLGTNRQPYTAHAQLVDVPLAEGPATEMVTAIIGSAPSATVAVDVVSTDYTNQSKSYIVPVPAIQELKREYARARADK